MQIHVYIHIYIYIHIFICVYIAAAIFLTGLLFRASHPAKTPTHTHSTQTFQHKLLEVLYKYASCRYVSCRYVLDTF